MKFPRRFSLWWATTVVLRGGRSMMCKRLGSGTQARILVVDWDQANARALAAVMRTAGFKVATACDGLEAVAEAAQFRPDLFSPNRTWAAFQEYRLLPESPPHFPIAGSSFFPAKRR